MPKKKERSKDLARNMNKGSYIVVSKWTHKQGINWEVMNKKIDKVKESFPIA